MRPQDALLAEIVRSSEDAISSVDLHGRITSWNGGAERLYGHPASEALGSPLSLHVPEESAPEFAECMERILRGETVRPLETLRKRRDGSIVAVSLTISPVRDETGAVIGASAVARDVTAENRANEFARKLLRAVEQAENVVLITDAGGRMIFVNPAFERVYGLPAGSALGQTPRILKSGKHDRAFYEAFWKSMLSGAGFHGEMVNRAGDGKLITVEVSANAILDDKGAVLGFFAVQHDVSERKLLEAQFMQSQKMEAVGRLAGGIAHDFNNLLTAILGYSEMLERNPPAGSTGEYAGQIRRAAESAASLTRQLLVFSRKQSFAVEVLDLNDLVRESQRILERVIGKNVEIRIDLDPSLGAVKVDRGQIAQVLMNLAVNARDAMPKGGTLTIKTENVDIEESYVPATVLLATPGRYVLVSVTDTGTGMDEATRSRMFEPFFTTKETDKGTGLGLSTVYGIVKQSGGFLWVYSEPGRGTIFKVFLPRASADVTRKAAAEPRPEPVARGTGTILLVENEEAVRSFIRLTLEEAGYAVLEAARGEDALETARRRSERIDLLVTDSVLPGIGGPELAGRLAAIHPETRILFISGYAGSSVLRDGAAIDDTAFLQKPFSAGVLTRRIRELLAGAAPD